jgi:hypothetical protein
MIKYSGHTPGYVEHVNKLEKKLKRHMNTIEFASADA